MYEIENNIARIAAEIKPGTEFVFPNDLDIPLLGKVKNFNHIDCCYLLFEIMKKYGIAISTDEICKDSFLTIRGLSEAVSHRIGS